MTQLDKLLIPTEIDLTLDGLVTFRRPELLSKDYIENIVGILQLTYERTTLYIDYYCDDDSYLSDNLGLETIASGDLTKESFGSIQERALQLMTEFMEDPEQEMIELIDEL